MKIEKRLNNDTKKNVSDIPSKIEDTLTGGRTIVIRDSIGELILSSTYESDTLESMIKIAIKIKASSFQLNQNESRSYIG